VFPYLSFIPLVFVVVPLLALRSKQVFMSYATAVFAAQMVLNALYLLVPATVSRPELTGTDVFSVLLRDLVWGLDEPINTFPSNHVALSVIAMLALAQLGLNKSLVLVLQLWLGVICISTLLVHQHVIWDVLAGAAIGALAYLATARIYGRSMARRG
jgi:membrane-associated phospholipid phosphatase